MFTLRLVRWNNLVINPNGALGYRLLRQYVVESGRFVRRRQRVAREWATYPSESQSRAQAPRVMISDEIRT